MFLKTVSLHTFSQIFFSVFITTKCIQIWNNNSRVSKFFLEDVFEATNEAVWDFHQEVSICVTPLFTLAVGDSARRMNSLLTP